MIAGQVRLDYVGIDPLKVERAIEATDEVSLRHMELGLRHGLDQVADIWRQISPRGNRTGTRASSAPRYSESIEVDVGRAGDLVVGEVVNTSAHARAVDYGTGVHRTDGASRTVIRAQGSPTTVVYTTKKGEVKTKRVGPFLKIPNREGSGYIFIKQHRGQRAQFVAKRAHVAGRERVTIAMRLAGYNAARELKARL